MQHVLLKYIVEQHGHMQSDSSSYPQWIVAFAVPFECDTYSKFGIEICVKSGIKEKGVCVLPVIQSEEPSPAQIKQSIWNQSNYATNLFTN